MNMCKWWEVYFRETRWWRWFPVGKSQSLPASIKWSLTENRINAFNENHLELFPASNYQHFSWSWPPWEDQMHAIKGAAGWTRRILETSSRNEPSASPPHAPPFHGKCILTLRECGGAWGHIRVESSHGHNALCGLEGYRSRLMSYCPESWPGYRRSGLSGKKLWLFPGTERKMERKLVPSALQSIKATTCMCALAFPFCVIESIPYCCHSFINVS